MNVRTLFLCMGVALTMAACSSDDDNENGGSAPAAPVDTPTDSLADYTIITMMQPGGNDCWTVDDLGELIALREEGKVGKNVNVIGLLRPSPDYQTAGVTDGCYLFDLKEKQGLKAEEIKALHDLDVMNHLNPFEDNSILRNEYLKYIFKNLDTRRICDAQTQINNSDTICSLIKRAVKLHPARHYVFMLYGHGIGYDPAADTASPSADATRACLDDNCRGGEKLGLDEFILGISKSGVKFQTLMTQCCLMATLENMTAYATQFDYFLGSEECTYGGYFPHFMQNLSAAGDNETKLKECFRDLVDTYVSHADSLNEVMPQPVATSYGWYDLRKMQALLSPVKDAAGWFIDANKKDTAFMRDVILNTYYATEVEDISKETPDSLQLFRDIVANPWKRKDVTKDAMSKVIALLLKTNKEGMECNFVFSTMLKAALDRQSSVKAGVTLDFAGLQKIYDQYMASLKDMAYIACNKDAVTPNADPYIYTSPSVQLVNFNKDYFFPLVSSEGIEGVEGMDFDQLVSELAETLYDLYQKNDSTAYDVAISLFYRGNFYATQYYKALLSDDTEQQKKYSVENIAAIYCATLFSKETGWGNLLMQTVTNPSQLFNPFRTM